MPAKKAAKKVAKKTAKKTPKKVAKKATKKVAKKATKKVAKKAAKKASAKRAAPKPSKSTPSQQDLERAAYFNWLSRCQNGLEGDASTDGAAAEQQLSN